MKLSVLLCWRILMSKGFVDRVCENGPGNVLESDAPNFETARAGADQRNSLYTTVGSCRTTKMQLVIGWIGGRPRNVDCPFCIFGISCMSPIVS